MWIEKTKNNKKLKRGELIMKYVVTINGKQYDVEVEKVSGGYKPMSMGAKAAPAAPAPAAPAPAPAPAAPKAAPVSAGDNTVTSPMPGTILGVKVKEGDAVKAGQLVIILEAMKMENEIVAPADGVVASVAVKEGDTVETDATLVVLK
ncbi:putative glutaconyl-CoA decarboxylase subunit gamma [Filifactor alocis ATCC 35896]|uniref:Glutaconyl-CoA decarboxylase subunit gamma n=2 Tax=Filifactor TaxID=44259 RepID=D6GTM9_FILAD|nr:putative glutaconyl-CoA decarboxylase subunit gamma [Filifactor alocis ATCC 35896]